MGLPVLMAAPVPGVAQTLVPAPTAAATQQTPAGQFIQDLGTKAIAVIADKSLT